MKTISLLFLIFLINNLTRSQTWVEQNSGVPGTSLLSVSASDERNVWVCGASGAVIKTTNGGINWVIVSSTPIPGTLSLYNIFGIDSSTALVTGSSNTDTYVYRTSNGGSNWTQVFTQSNGFIDAIGMGNAQAGFMYGDPVGGRWSLWGTIDGGVTWDSVHFNLPQAGSETGYNNAFFFDAISQAVWFGTNNTRVYRSTNLILWNSQITTGQVNSYALWFNSPFNGMTGGTAVLSTTNFGMSWSPTPSILPGTGNITGITGMDSSWWVVRQATQIYFTGNNGANWITQYTAPSGNYGHITKSRGGIPTLYAVRSNGGISKATGLVGLNTISNRIPKEFILMQNYPNPFNPSTKIRFEIPPIDRSHAFDVQIIIYDMLGREVALLVNEELNPGSYSVTFDGSNYASGVYYYTIYAGSFTDTKKMMLVK
jgi:photosystem II stability/assembly factor-like uncharacterized protein